MNPLLTDPVVLICSGIIVFGLLGLFWAIAKLSRLPAAEGPLATNAPFTSSVDDLRDLEIAAPRVQAAPAAAPVTAPAPAAAVSKEVADRLESMTQRLSEMQAVLTRQSSGTPTDSAGGVGQGFSPETIDKLLKIIGNVIQQVDILQRSVAPGKDTAATKSDTPGTPAAKV